MLFDDNRRIIKIINTSWTPDTIKITSDTLREGGGGERESITMNTQTEIIRNIST